MRNFRILLTLSGLGIIALGGYHVAARASTFVASTILPAAVEGDYVDRFPDLSMRRYELGQLSILRQSLGEVSERYVDPARIDYPAMFRAGLEAVERLCPEVVLRLDGERLHVMVDRYTTTLQVRPLDTPEDVVSEAQRVAQILQSQLPAGDYEFPEIEYALVNGMLSTLDPHTMLMPPVAARKMQEDNDGSFGGLGISISMHNGELTIEYPMAGTPAARAGLKPGDKIVKIEGEGTFNMDIDDAVAKMRGPAGTPITVSVTREGMDIPRDVKMIRAEIRQAAVWGELLDGNIAYVEIPQFHALVDSQLDAELSALARKASPGGLKGLVLDMRDNPGGYLEQAIKVGDKFLSQGVVVATVGPNDSDREERSAQNSGTEPKYPIIVIMSGNSASAAEIVAGALKNQERAAILGERSFGKGSVQEINKFTGDAQLKLTVRRYLTPGDHSIQEIGIPPDIELKRAYVEPPRKIEGYDVMSGPVISMFAREHLTREADLNGHFTNAVNLETPPVYSLRYLAAVPDDTVKSDRKDAKKDFEVQLARDVLLATQGSRRADVLRGAETVVAARQKTQQAAIAEAFAAQKIDWSACNATAPVAADVVLEFAVTGTDSWGSTLVPGELTDARATVTNRGATPMCQTLVRAESPKGNDIVDGTEFYFGKVRPGEVRTYTSRIKVPAGYPTEVAPVRLQLTDMSGATLSDKTVEINTAGQEFPAYAWDWVLSDAEGGNGNGLPEVGETVSLKLKVTNVGPGKGGEGTFNLRKTGDMGKSVELKEARLVYKGLAPGQSVEGSLSFRIAAEPPDAALSFELTVRDNERYDYAAITRGGYYEYFAATEKIAMTLGKAVAPVHRQPPRIEITRAPSADGKDGQSTVSGVASDDVGVRNVIVYHSQQKLAYAGGGDAAHPAPTVPFSATADLDEGNNLIVIAARDGDGLTTTRTLSILQRPTLPQAPEP
ncbi:MAG: PDZ domain-containing protein [Myxococcales bacterium]|nr:PDZ domain-containing protein [Myxococcales bacterium]